MRFALLASTALLLAACMGKQTAVVTADEQGQVLSVIHADGHVTPVAVPAMPHNVQISADGKRIFATGMTGGHAEHHMTGGGALLMLDADRMDSSAVTMLALGKHPAHVITDKSGKTVYVTDSESDSVLVVDAVTRKLVRSLPTGKFPHGLRMNPERPELYTANVKDGTVSVINLTTNRETHRIPVGGKPIQVAVTPDGKKLYVSLAKDSAVAVVDLSSYNKIKGISVSHAPAQLYADPKGRYIYSANQGTSENPGRTISVINTVTDQVEKQIETGRMPHGIVADTAGQFLYVTNMGENTMAKISVADWRVVETTLVGDLPNGITLVE